VLFSDAKSIEIKQKIDLLEAFTGFEKENKYIIRIRTEDDDKVKWTAKEKSDCFTRNFCNPRQRALEIAIKDDDDDTIFKLKKECALACLDCCCLPEMKLIDRDDDKDLGVIKLNCNLCPQLDLSV